MDKETSIHQLKEVVNTFVHAREWRQFHTPKDLASALHIETSELAQHFLWKTESEIKDILNNPKKREQISEELADILYLLLNFSDEYKFDLATALNEKIKKNEAKYPTETSRGSSRKYNEK
ncbi:MAG TPA: nucleotide pyrophosphohydrolase [Candidatus Nanoarchaeia archaeon]|nr:nucleotide pyrophosphohydrolase [Candidatus Nanoarchaeia archaeon]